MPISAGKNIELQIVNKIPEIEKVCNSITTFSRQNSVDEKIIANLYLAIDELLTNIINYGYKDEKEHPIKIRYSIENELLTLQIEDDSYPYDPNDAPLPDLTRDLEDRKIGGLGIYLVKSMMDDIKYITKNGINTLTLTKKLTIK
jgi:anti-sigma regulatory factor (Ser/Thr protein kinase)